MAGIDRIPDNVGDKSQLFHWLLHDGGVLCPSEERLFEISRTEPPTDEESINFRDDLSDVRFHIYGIKCPLCAEILSIDGIRSLSIPGSAMATPNSNSLEDQMPAAELSESKKELIRELDDALDSESKQDKYVAYTKSRLTDCDSESDAHRVINDVYQQINHGIRKGLVIINMEAYIFVRLKGHVRDICRRRRELLFTDYYRRDDRASDAAAAIPAENDAASGQTRNRETMTYLGEVMRDVVIKAEETRAGLNHKEAWERREIGRQSGRRIAMAMLLSDDEKSVDLVNKWSSRFFNALCEAIILADPNGDKFSSLWGQRSDPEILNP